MVFNGDVSTDVKQSNAITGDPLFVDETNHDYNLQSNSPAVNSGNNTLNTTLRDLSGNARIYATTIELGVYENFDQFIEIPSTLPSIAGSAVKWGDIDNDGDLDVVMVGVSEDSTPISRIYTNDGNFTFSLKQNLLGVASGDVAFGDIDNDGDLDILLSGSPSGVTRTSKTYINDGDGNYTEKSNPLQGVYSCAVAFGDIDNDGDLDILLSGSEGGIPRAKTYINDGNGNYTEKSNSIIAVIDTSVAFGDIDNDNDLDILITGRDAGHTIITKTYINDGNGNYTEKTNPLQGVFGGNGKFGDIDNDGDLDIMVTGYYQFGNLKFTQTYTNDGHGNYTELTNPFTRASRSHVALGDINNSGSLDAIYIGDDTNNNYIAKNYINDGHGVYTEQVNFFTEVINGSVSMVDIDSNGTLDVFITGEMTNGTKTSKIYKNIILSQNQKPSAPLNPTAVINPDNTVTFSWDRANDNETPSLGLSYNILLKESPEATPLYITSPEAQESNGWQKVVQLGNAMQNNSYVWNVPTAYNVPSKDFIFKVQAIDHSFAGSLFSESHTFNLDTTLSIDHFSIHEFLIYPNPVTNAININTDIQEYNYVLYNVQGQEIIKGNNNKTNIINVSQLPSGIYLLKLKNKNILQSFKIIKQ